MRGLGWPEANLPLGYVRWQAIIALFSILLLGLTLGYLAYNLTTIVTPDYGGTYIEGVAGNPSTINPILCHFNPVDRDLAALIYNGLTRADEGGMIRPDLARRWEVTDDGLVYTFYLRDDVRWHDGAPFTARDVGATIQAIQDQHFQGAPFLADMWRTVTVEGLGPHTIRFVLQEPYAPFLEHTTIGILPAHLIEGITAQLLPKAQFNTQPIGTGPFRVAEVDATHIFLEANPAYYGRRPYLDKIEFLFYPDYPSIFAAHRRGEVAGISRVLPEHLDMVREDQTLNLYSAPLSGYSLVFLNLARPVFKDREVRQALLWGLDRQGIVDEVLGGQGIVIHSPIMANSWAYAPDLTQYERDPKAAIQLLEDAGWEDRDGDGVREKDGVSLRFTLSTNADNQHRVRMVREIASQLAEIGVLVVPETLDWQDLVGSHLRTREYDATLYGWSLLPSDPDLYPHWHSTQIGEDGQNYTGYVNVEADRLLEQARRAVDITERGELSRRFQEIFAEDVPSLLLYQPVYNYAVDQRVRGVQVGPMTDSADRFRTVGEWHIATKRVILSEATPAAENDWR